MNGTLSAHGAGKSATLMCIAGHVELQCGQTHYKESNISSLSPIARVIAGVGLVLEGRRLFDELTRVD